MLPFRFFWINIPQEVDPLTLYRKMNLIKKRSDYMKYRMDWELEQQAIDEMAETAAVVDLCKSILAQLDKVRR